MLDSKKCKNNRKINFIIYLTIIFVFTMAIKQIQQLKLSQRITPQQLLLMQLLKLPNLLLEQRIKEELETNPALEEALDFSEDIEDSNNEANDNELQDENDQIEAEIVDEKDTILEDFMDQESLDDYKTETHNQPEEPTQKIISDQTNFYHQLEEQLLMSNLNEQELLIGQYLIGCIDDDGYIRRELDLIQNDLLLTYALKVSTNDIEAILKVIQTFEPAGIASRTLQECLLIQLERKQPKLKETYHAVNIIKKMMSEFSKKHYEKIQLKLNLTNEDLKDALLEITHLNPKPGSANDSNLNQAIDIVPDFNLNIKNEEIELSLIQGFDIDLVISKDYIAMLKQYETSKSKLEKEASGFIKNKIESAKWFIEALQLRNQTMILVMNAIVEIQTDFFLTGDETTLKPMTLKLIEEKINLSISTISRVINSKYILTPCGTFLLKFFFSDAMTDDKGDHVSTKKIKKLIQNQIQTTDNIKPLTDEEMKEAIHKQGITIARRTIAKYRKQLNAPVARLRKSI